MKTKRNLLYQHIRAHATIYMFVLILFLTGIVFGAVLVNSMNFVQKQDLYFYLERFFNEMSKGETIQNKTIFTMSLLYHAKYLCMMFLLGLSVIGLPLVWIFLFLKGLVVGFSVGFIVNQLGWKGLLLAGISIAPQNMLVIPIYLIAGGLSMIFSLSLLNRLFRRNQAESIVHPFKKYFFIYIVLLVLSIIAAGLEAFVSNGAMQILVKSFYN